MKKENRKPLASIVVGATLLIAPIAFLKPEAGLALLWLWVVIAFVGFGVAKWKWDVS